jgi:hypothetical protein
MQIPKSTELRNIAIAWPGRAGRLIIAPGDAPVMISHIYNWDDAPGEGGTGGDPMLIPGYNPEIGVRDPRSFEIPVRTLKIDLYYTSDDDFDLLRDV